MASVTIRLVIDKATGKKDVIISYASEADALPFEHEDEHKRVVDKLIEGGALAAADLGKIVVERVSKNEQAEEQAGAEAQGERARVSGKG